MTIIYYAPEFAPHVGGKETYVIQIIKVLKKNQLGRNFKDI